MGLDVVSEFGSLLKWRAWIQI